MPDRQEFIDFILDHYENPRHHGPLENPDVVMKGGNPGCGDIVTLYVRLDGNERIADVSFEGEGCTISQAAASIVTDKVISKTLSEVADLNAEFVVDEMGREVVANRLRCATLALNTLKAAEKKYRAGQAAKSAAEATVENF
ncbi:MAG: Fe-S cluster assembly sulfur transfer protein SufU [Anaerolineales bacterium]